MPNKLISLILTLCIIMCCTTGCDSVFHEHNYSEATCTKPKKCACGETDGEPLGHDYAAATCTKAEVCKKCKKENGKPLGHEYSEATCTSAQICSKCGDVVGTPLGHDYADATCTLPKTCHCGVTVGTALGHDLDAATCTSPAICKVCGTAEGKELGHDYIDATCFAPKTCSRCERVDGEALGHDFVDNICSRCEMVDPESLPVGLNELHLIECSGTFGYSYEYNTGNFTDSFGNNYIGYHFFNANDSGTYAMYNLNGMYSDFSFDIVAPNGMSSEYKVTIEVFVDDILKYSKTEFSNTTGKTNVNIDVENGSILKIKITRTAGVWIYDVGIGIVNAQLTK